MSRICDIQNSLEANRGPVFSKHKCGLFSNETNVYIHIYRNFESGNVGIVIFPSCRTLSDTY